MSDLTKQLGKRVRVIREHHGLSPQALATNAGVSRATIIRIEDGTHPTNIDILCAVARELGVTAGELLGETQLDEVSRWVLKGFSALNEIQKRLIAEQIGRVSGLEIPADLRFPDDLHEVEDRSLKGSGSR